MAQYHIVASQSGNVFDVEAGKAEDGTRVLMWGAKGPHEANQNWRFEHLEDGYFLIVSAIDPEFVLSVDGHQAYSGAPLVLWCRQEPVGPSQLWKWEGNSLKSALDHRFSVDCQTAREGDQLILYDHHGGKNQQFYQHFST